MIKPLNDASGTIIFVKQHGVVTLENMRLGISFLRDNKDLPKKIANPRRFDRCKSNFFD